jgi:hypothetical protein
MTSVRLSVSQWFAEQYSTNALERLVALTMLLLTAPTLLAVALLLRGTSAEPILLTDDVVTSRCLICDLLNGQPAAEAFLCEDPAIP